MASIFSIMLSGLLVGILISAPMGPIGVLVIQRTLTKGRWPGFFTGLGAGLSDIIYCLLTGLGLSLVIDFIERNQNVLQIIGSIFLIGYAVYLFKANPSRSLRPPSETANTYWRDFWTGFLFTFSNPLILFFIISLFARFSFLAPEYRYYHYVLGYISIVAGALVWWTTITFIVDKVRGHFNLRSMWIVNRIIGSLIGLMAIFGLVTGIIAIT